MLLPARVGQGHLYFTLFAISGVSLVMYLALPQLREAHSAAEVVILFTISYFAMFTVLVREPIWVARDCRQIYIEDSRVEQLSLHYRLGIFTHRGQKSAYSTLLAMARKVTATVGRDPFCIGRKWIGQTVDEPESATKSRRSLYDDRGTSRDLAQEQSSKQGNNYMMWYCNGCLGVSVRIAAILSAVFTSFTPAFVRLLSGGSFFGNGDVASAAFMILTSIVCVIVYGSFALLLSSGIQGSQACWLLVTMLMALPKRETDRVRREREAMPDGLGRLSLTNAASLDAFMSLRKVVLTEVRQVLVSLERSEL